MDRDQNRFYSDDALEGKNGAKNGAVGTDRTDSTPASDGSKPDRSRKPRIFGRRVRENDEYDEDQEREASEASEASGFSRGFYTGDDPEADPGHDSEAYPDDYAEADSEGARDYTIPLDPDGEEGEDKNAQVPLNEVTYFTTLFEYLREALTRGIPMPAGYRVVDARNCLRILDDMERNLPGAVDMGMKLIGEEDRMLTSAQQRAKDMISSANVQVETAFKSARAGIKDELIEAEARKKALLQEAEERAAQMVSESEIVARAQEEAKMIVNEAREEARRLREGTRQELYTLLGEVDGQLTEACKSVRRRRSELQEDETF